MGRVRGGGFDCGLDGDRSPIWLHVRAGWEEKDLGKMEERWKRGGGGGKRLGWCYRYLRESVVGQAIDVKGVEETTVLASLYDHACVSVPSSLREFASLVTSRPFFERSTDYPRRIPKD